LYVRDGDPMALCGVVATRKELADACKSVAILIVRAEGNVAPRLVSIVDGAAIATIATTSDNAGIRSSHQKQRVLPALEESSSETKSFASMLRAADAARKSWTTRHVLRPC
jgi:hypothetical protein